MKKDILIFGDSIAYGIGDPILGGWVDLLKRHVWEHQPTLNVYNFCIDGNSTREILQRLTIQSAQTLYAKEAIFIAVGINDSISYADGQHFMVDIEFQDNLHKIITQAQTFTDHVYVVGLTHVDESLTNPFPQSRTGKSFTNQRIAMFNTILQTVAAETETTFIPMIDLLADADMFDGLHVNTIGQKKMFDRLLEQVHFLD